MAKRFDVNRCYTADFETTKDGDICRVWSWSIASIMDEKVVARGIDIHSFMEWCAGSNDPILYFHNLKFDGHYLLYYILELGFVHRNDSKPKNPGEFTALITRDLRYYKIALMIKSGRIITFCDSLKIIVLPVSEIARMYKMKIRKGSIDHTKYRPIGYQPTAAEWSYQDGDVLIMAKALKVVFEAGLHRITMGSNSLHDAISTTFKNKREYRKMFPCFTNSLDNMFREAYFGGWVFVNPLYRGRAIGKGMALDKNSQYSDKVVNAPLPYGDPIPFDGDYEYDENYPLFIMTIFTSWTLKKGHFPTQRIKHNMRYDVREYYEKADGVYITVTNYDMELLRRHYDLGYTEYIGGYKFRAAVGVFANFINKWMSKKEVDKGGERDVDKRMMNGFTGKMASRMESRSARPYIDRDTGIMSFDEVENELRAPEYTPFTVFVTSISRYEISEIAQGLGERFIYSDTDCTHITGWDMPETLKNEIHQTEMGKFKVEYKFTIAKYLRPKGYIAKIPDGKGGYKYKITVAGMNEKAYEHINLANFKEGLELEDVSLEPVSCIGGVELQGKPFSIRKNDISLFS